MFFCKQERTFHVISAIVVPGPEPSQPAGLQHEIPISYPEPTFLLVSDKNAISQLYLSIKDRKSANRARRKDFLIGLGDSTRSADQKKSGLSGRD